MRPRPGARHGDEALEPALRLAFGPSGSSISTGAVSACGSSSAGAEPTPALAELPGLPQRFAIERLLGRGGVGEIYRAYDAILDRPIAIKVLSERHRDHHGLVRRFVREARVSASLAHPGIVPVHDVGWLLDGRPWLAMKLVEGRALDRILEDMPRPAERGSEAQRLIEIFLAVCHAVAHAHARGIVHRDLKPANVMVGAFGEVQVMDWGMAKLLAMAEWHESADGKISESVERGDDLHAPAGSTPGSVYGTWAYMAPEQARGELEKIKPATDVFGLGSLLCEILTGAPPYRGTSETCRSAAKQAALADALSRLREEHVDSVLGALARRCLAPEPAERPRDAGEVACKIEAHLATAAARARDAELAAIRATARAISEQRARRAMLWIMASVLVAIVAIALSWWTGMKRSERTTHAVDLALRDFEARFAEARAGGAEPEVPWLAAVESARRARELARTGDVHPELRARAEAAYERANHATGEAASERARTRKDREIAQRLDELRVAPIAAWSWMEQEGRYAAAFRDHGIDLASLSDDAVADAIRGSRIATALVGALDDWAFARRVLEDLEGFSRLRRIADLADSDATRARIRAITTAGEALAVLAELDLETLEPATASLLFGRFLGLELPTQALSVLHIARRRHPGDFWLSYRLGQFAGFLGIGRGEALQAYEAAWAAQPNGYAAANNLATLQVEAGNLEDAAAILERLVELHPSAGILRANLGTVRERQGRIEEALALFRSAFEIDPREAGSLVCVARMLRKLGRTEDAVRTYEQAFELAPNDPYVMTGMGAALCDLLNRPADAAAMFRRALAVDPKRIEARANLATALRKSGEHDEALQVASDVLARDEARAPMHSLRAAVLTERGRHEEARAAIRRALELEERNASFWSLAGKIEEALGNAAAANEASERATACAPERGDLWRQLGNLRWRTDRRVSALAAYERAAEVEPASAEAWNHVREASSFFGDLASAARACERLSALVTVTDAAWLELSELHLRSGDLEEAETIFLAVEERAGVQGASALCHRLLTVPSAENLEPRLALAIARYRARAGNAVQALPFFDRALTDRGAAQDKVDALARLDAACAALAASDEERAARWLAQDLAKLELDLCDGSRESAAAWLLGRWYRNAVIAAHRPRAIEGSVWERLNDLAERVLGGGGERKREDR